MSGIFSAGGAGNVGVSGFYPVTINDSLRFEDGSSAYLNRTPASATNRTTWTWSAWVKRGNISQSSNMFIAYSGANDFEYIRFDSDDTIRYTFYVSGSQQNLLSTSGKFRDTSSWYHILVQRSGSSSEIYVNGIQQALNIGTRVSGNGYFNSTNAHNIGRFTSGSQYFDGYMTEINFIDGQSLAPTSFGEAKEGTWIPKSYSGSYGTNGFHLEFNSNTNDTSGNGNNWTANNISAHDYVPDSPTNNFATFNPLDNIGTSNFSEGNLKVGSSTGSVTQKTRSTFAVSQNFYFEAYRVDGGTQNFNVGVATATADIGSTGNTGVYTKNYSGGAGDILMFAYSASANALWTGLNGTWDNSATVAEIEAGTTTNATHTGIADEPIAAVYIDQATSYSGRIITNFGQDSTFAGATTAGGNTDANGVGDFKYAPPSGFLSLCSANLPEPVVGPLGDSLSDENFNTVLWTGTGSGQSITGMGFQPDWLWFKQRNGGSDHALIDSVRGVNQGLISNSTAQEVTSGASNDLVSFDSDGFTTGTPQNFGSLGSSGLTIATWGWKAGTAFSNSAGSNGATIASSGSVNTDAGFSIVSYTGSGANGTVLHGLSSAPEIIFFKKLDVATSWMVYNKTIGNNRFLYLDLTNGQTGTDSTYFNNLDPTASVINLGTYHRNNSINERYIAYAFHSVDGYSKVGSYTGNGSGTDAPFVFTGFSPAFVLIKSTASGNWLMFDNKREGYNPCDVLYADDPTSEETSSTKNIDILSNGFKIGASTNVNINTSGLTYIFLAFAENPFKYANAR